MGYSATKVIFKGKPVTAVVYLNQVWVPLVELCRNIGLRSPHSQMRKLETSQVFKGQFAYIQLHTKTCCLHLEALPHWLASIQMKRIKNPETQRALALYTQEYAQLQQLCNLSIPTPSPATRLISQAEVLFSVEATQSKILQRLATIEKRMDARSARECAAAAATLGFKETNNTSHPSNTKYSPRTALNKRIQTVATREDKPPQQLWNILYREFKDRVGIDLQQTAATQQRLPLNVASADGYIEQLYNLCCFLWPQQTN